MGLTLGFWLSSICVGINSSLVVFWVGINSSLIVFCGIKSGVIRVVDYHTHLLAKEDRHLFFLH